MVNSIKASEPGLRIVDQTRRKKGWNKTAEAWCMQGFTSRATLSRFWAGQPIRKEIFIAICDAVGANWQEVADCSETPEDSISWMESYANRNDSEITAASDADTKVIHCTTHSDDRQDWGDAPSVTHFYGRMNEQAMLNQWIGQERCHLVALLGMGGLGKTALAAKVAQFQLHHAEFEFVIWRNLRNAPPLADLLSDLLQFLSSQQINVPTTLDGKLLQLLKVLRAHRCLLIFDGLESILQDSSETTYTRDYRTGYHHTGSYRAGYEDYEQLFTCISDTSHQSCLMLTSREMPKGLSILEGEALPVRCLRLQGVDWTEGQQIVQTKTTLTGSAGEWATFIERYAGNPLVLKIVASTVRDLFGGSISEFLKFSQNRSFLVNEVRELLEEHVHRLSQLEQDLLYWLSINDKPIAMEELQEGVAYPLSISELMQTIATLQRHSLIEITIEPTTHTAHSSLVLKYTTNSLIEQMSWGISQQPDKNNPLPLQYQSTGPESHKNNRIVSFTRSLHTSTLAQI
jgi:hypothetical protein